MNEAENIVSAFECAVRAHEEALIGLQEYSGYIKPEALTKLEDDVVETRDVLLRTLKSSSK